MSVTAGDVVNIVRDLIPDPIYTSGGTPQPASDGGLFRSQTLVRWINDGAKSLAEQMGWTVEDWTAISVTKNQAFYTLDSKWVSFELGYQNAFQLALTPESFTVWPKAVSGSQSTSYAIHKTTDHWELGLFPVPNTTDPTSTVATTMNASVSSLTVASSSGFLPYGYVQIENEVCWYGAISGNVQLTPLLRAQCGTTAATHSANVSVSHLSAWFKGVRNPNEITATTDVIEIPNSFMWALQEYVMAKASIAQNDLQAGQLHMTSFRQECKRIQQDPGWRREAQGRQVIPYGLPLAGRLAWGPWGVVVP